MHREREVVDESAEGRVGLMVLALLALLVGAGSGLIGARRIAANIAKLREFWL